MKPQSERAIIQVAHVVRDLEKAIHAYSRVFEVGPWDVYTFAPPTLRESMYLGKPSDHTYRLAVAEYAKKGISVIQSGKFGEDEFYYLDTEPTVGIVIELGNNGKIPPPELRLP